MILSLTASAATAVPDDFPYLNEQFADIQLLRYQVPGFERLSLRQKTFIYHMSQAALAGRDIFFDQNGRYNLRIRHLLEAVYTQYPAKDEPDYLALTQYLKRVWFSGGIHHHYGCEKFLPTFTQQWLRQALEQIGYQADEALFPVMFDPQVMPMRVNQKDGDDLLLTSAMNYYAPGITQREAEEFYAQRKSPADPRPVMMGMNSRLVRNEFGLLDERVWRVGGLYTQAIERVVEHLEAALPHADRMEQQVVLQRLIEFYRTGDLRTFDHYTIIWLKDTESLIDFVNGFTESYGDPLGMKASWEGYVNFKDLEATQRATTLSQNAQWFEDHSPIDPAYKKPEVKGVSAKVVTAAIIGGDLYPATAIGINLPNSDWVRRDFGSKSVTIANFTAAYAKASQGSGMDREFVIDEVTRQLIKTYGHLTDDLHTDLHECLGHGSGRLLPTTDPDSLGVYGSTIEEARADLFALYYLADEKLVELGLTPHLEAHQAAYYTYLMNGALTQLVRIKLGHHIEEAHMRNRALIARWVLEQAAARKTGKPAAELTTVEGKTYLRIHDYAELRQLFGELLREIQRIKSEGDFSAARQLVEDYAVRIDPQLHQELLERYDQLGLAPYKGFINPRYTALRNDKGQIVDVKIDYDEAFDEQNLRYSREHGHLPLIND